MNKGYLNPCAARFKLPNFSMLALNLILALAPVPETGSTVALLGLALTGLVFLRRKLH
jgi:VPDSG-CTERM motif